MKRYIDAEELIKKIKKCEFEITGCGIMYHAGNVQSAINFSTPADVVPKSEVENYKQVAEYQQKLAIDRYFEIKRLEEELATAKAEVAREIFEELDKFIVTRVCVIYGQVYDISDEYKQLKDKYTEGNYHD